MPMARHRRLKPTWEFPVEPGLTGNFQGQPKFTQAGP
ncbi:MAG: hypothetical protein QOE54_6223 [Streptosporangiaceae bacterium]|jgi:hypothetical protein|nr:hypothetical protein [Streptosporangiaceae bacterium]